MAAKDADMPTHHALGEDIQEISNRLHALREELESLTSTLSRAGEHQAERIQDAARETIAAVEAAVRRNPLQALGIALGAGFLVAIVLRR